MWFTEDLRNYSTLETNALSIAIGENIPYDSVIAYQKDDNYCTFPVLDQAIDLTKAYYEHLPSTTMSDFEALETLRSYKRIICYYPFDLTFDSKKYTKNTDDGIFVVAILDREGNQEATLRDFVSKRGQTILIGDQLFPFIRTCGMLEEFGEQLNVYINIHRYRDLYVNHHWDNYNFKHKDFTSIYIGLMKEKYREWVSRHTNDLYRWWQPPSENDDKDNY